MCTKKYVLIKKIFNNRLKIILPLGGWAEKSVHEMETHWLSGKEKVQDTAVSKEVHTDSFLKKKHQN